MGTVPSASSSQWRKPSGPVPMGLNPATARSACATHSSAVSGYALRKCMVRPSSAVSFGRGVLCARLLHTNSSDSELFGK